jgi:hypothetical protein
MYCETMFIASPMVPNISSATFWRASQDALVSLHVYQAPLIVPVKFRPGVPALLPHQKYGEGNRLIVSKDGILLHSPRVTHIVFNDEVDTWAEVYILGRSQVMGFELCTCHGTCTHTFGIRDAPCCIVQTPSHPILLKYRCQPNFAPNHHRLCVCVCTKPHAEDGRRILSLRTTKDSPHHILAWQQVLNPC